MLLRLFAGFLLPAVALLGGCAVGVPLALIGGQELVGTQLTARQTAQPLEAVGIPEPREGATKPAVLLLVERERWDASEKPRGPAAAPEFDNELVDRTRRLFIEQTCNHRLFSRLSVDPFDAPKTDYTIHIFVRNRNEQASLGRVMLTVYSGFLITSTSSDRYALRMEVRDRQNRLIQSSAAENTKLTMVGIAALGIAEPKATVPPKSVEEQLVMKALRAVALSGIYAPVAPRQPPAPTAVPPKVVAQAAPVPASKP